MFISGAAPAGPAALSAALRDYASLLPPLHALVAHVARHRLRGAPLLSLLSARAGGAGAPSLAAAFGRLAWHARRAAFDQLAAWCVHGTLADAHHEFFVVPGPGAAVFAAEGAEAPPASAVEGDTGADDDDGGAAEWHGGAALALDALPPWLELPAAEAALFCGRAARVLRRPRGPHAPDAHQLAPPPAAAAAAAARLAALADAPHLRRDAVDAALAELRADAAERLWSLLVSRARLPAHLRALRDYFLMARGDFWAVFLEEARAVLAQPPRAAGAAAALAPALAAAAAQCGGGDDDCLRRLRLSFDPGAPSWAGAALPGLDAWDGVRPRYALSWPLGLLLTPPALDTYAALHAHLFRLKRAQAALATAWASLRRAPPANAGAGGGAAASALRHRMDALLGAWGAHVARDVIAPAHAAMLRRVDAARDWREAARAHAAFLAAARSGALLDLRPAAKALEALLQLALALAAHVRAGGAAQAGRTAELDAHWRRQAQAFAAVLRGPAAAAVGAAGRAPALRAFLQRCDDDGLVPPIAQAAGAAA